MLLRIWMLTLLLALVACQKHASEPPHEGIKPAQSSAGASQQEQARHMPIGQMSPSFLYLASQKALKEGNHRLAIELLTALVKQDPEAVDPHFQLIRLLLAAGHFDQAGAHIDQLLKVNNLTPAQIKQLQLSRARLFQARGQNDQALALLDQFLRQHPDDIAGRDLQARLLSSLERYDQALAAIAAAIRIRERPEFRLLQAQLFLKRNDLADARVSLARMQKLKPESEEPVLLLSELAVREKNIKQAETLLRDYFAVHPESLRTRLALAKLLVGQNRLFDAILIYRDLVTRSGNNPEVLQQLGMLYFRHQDYGESEQVFRSLLKTRGDDISRFYLAASLEAQKKNDQAEKLYEQIDAGSQLAVEAQLRLAAIDVGKDDSAGAVRRLQSILKQKPEHLDAHLLLSTIRLNNREYRQLIDESNALMARSPLPAQLLFNRAVAFDHFKQYDQSEEILNRIIKRHPDHAEALNFLAYTYAVQGKQLKLARVLIDRALTQKPDDGYYLDSLAWIYFKSGDYARAVAPQEKALKQIPDDPVMREHYGDIMWKNGKPDIARAAWRKAIELKSERSKEIKRKIRDGLSDL